MQPSAVEVRLTVMTEGTAEAPSAARLPLCKVPLVPVPVSEGRRAAPGPQFSCRDLLRLRVRRASDQTRQVLELQIHG